MRLTRRQFAATLAAPALAFGADASTVEVQLNPADPLVKDPSVLWAIEDLKSALGSRLSTGTPRPSLRIAVGRPTAPIKIPGRADRPAESFEITAPRANGIESSRQFVPTFAVTASDAAGLKLGVLELADRVRHGSDWPQSQTEQPFLKVRGNMRLFCSELEDKPWFYDRAMWPQYFSMLATNRFNRFQLAFSIGYDFLRDVTDAYALFPYPFFLTDVPGFKVRATNLPDSEPARNLETLRYISDQAAAHGIHFQLGLWMHGYVWENSPRASHVITGLDAQTHAPYCRDALTLLLKACPNINGITLRIHGESGVTEGSYDFWKTIFDGAVRSGRKIQLDLHAKGIDQQMIDNALATGLPVQVSPKFWAEHMGMPYLQASIRELEMPKAENAKGLMALSTGTRSFTRYSYADLLRADRKYHVLHRIWPGTQRLLLWGDPVFAAAYAKAFSTAGSDGVEIMEPLSFKGRRGSGKPGGRCGYADASLNPKWDWEKYRYTYRVWGHHLYNPTPDPDVYRRELRTEYGPDAAKVESALSAASRILPLVTTAYAPSAANNTYWPEMYTNQPIVDPKRKNPYGDTPSPKVFGNATAFDPELFGSGPAKYHPVEVAAWLDRFATEASATDLSKYRRAAIDIQIQAGIARFFAAKFRAAQLFADNRKDEALAAYREARAHWAKLAEAARGVYLSDVTVGELDCLRGHWLDRLPAIDADIADMEAWKPSAAPTQTTAFHATPTWSHTRAASFRPNVALPIDVAATTVPTLHYRHLNQGERWQSIEMTPAAAGRYRAEIPAPYTASPFHLQYYFSATKPNPVLYPGLGPNLSQQPYFITEVQS